MNVRNLIMAGAIVLAGVGPSASEEFLIHIHTGPDNPTKAALGFLVAMTAQKEGHTVNVFLAGDGASLITDATISSVEGQGTGKLQESFDALISTPRGPQE